MTERFAEIVARLAEIMDGPPARGEPLPVIQPDEAATVAAVLHAELDRGTAARAALAAQQGIKIACDRGCNACCENLVVVTESEALAAAAWLALPENAAVLAQFRAAYPAWSALTGDAPARLDEHMRRGEREAHRRVLLDHWRKRVLCAFNQDGACSIYPVRPLACRHAHALDTAEHCVAGTGRAAATLGFAPVDEFLARARKLLLAAHIASVGPARGPEPICTAVARLLPEDAKD